jgi:hypothetical protein
LSNRIVVAGGGGGGSHAWGGGAIGRNAGYDGGNGFDRGNPTGGGGATHFAGGAAGTSDGYTSNAGILGQGGGIQMWSETTITNMNGYTYIVIVQEEVEVITVEAREEIRVGVQDPVLFATAI